MGENINNGGGYADLEKQMLILHDHEEKHFMSSEIVRDIIIGVSDGLTVPFALAAGLSGADVSSSIILIAGVAEVAAGAISMGLGGYLAAKSEADHYVRELKREQDEIVAVPDTVFQPYLSFHGRLDLKMKKKKGTTVVGMAETDLDHNFDNLVAPAAGFDGLVWVQETEAAEVAEILAQYGVEPHEYGPVVNALRRNPQAWVDFMMKFELGLEKPDPMRAIQSALTIAFSYIMGGFVPLLPYMIFPIAKEAVVASVILTIVALLIFGFAKGYFTGTKPFKSAFQTALIGAIASAAAYSIAKAFQAF
ncbi:hypothetical protein G4B88_009059 [Cannabis sativa]|uniref:Vacuolar iron transporter 1 n=1 Tax=Cannabis sativa TaxID=3483 RepID=A0A7J6HPM2_CANSA|nr:hypothetical protein G4B88_009059 [Cannabis sativa]